MGNSANRRRARNGVIRPGPAARAEEARVREELQREVAGEVAGEEAVRRVRRRVANCAYQQAHRARARAQLVQAVVVANEPVEPQMDVLCRRDQVNIASRIVQCIVEELKNCPGPFSRHSVIDRVMGDNVVWPLLPPHYPHPVEAKALQSFLESFKSELNAVKNPYSNNMLARKGALLDAAVGSGVSGVRALSRVLQTKTANISRALDRQHSRSDDATSKFVPLQRTKRHDGLTALVKETVIAFWHNYTRVSPNKKDIVRKRIGPRSYDSHPTHYLTETQVSQFRNTTIRSGFRMSC